MGRRHVRRSAAGPIHGEKVRDVKERKPLELRVCEAADGVVAEQLADGRVRVRGDPQAPRALPRNYLPWMLHAKW